MCSRESHESVHGQDSNGVLSMQGDWTSRFAAVVLGCGDTPAGLSCWTMEGLAS